MTKKAPAPRRQVWDNKILWLMEYCLATKLCPTQREFFLSIGYSPENAKKLKSGAQSVRPVHILKAAQVYNINLNWLFGLDTNMKRTKSKAAIDQLREAVAAVEKELRHK